jgi:hypothetical protein
MTVLDVFLNTLGVEFTNVRVAWNPAVANLSFAGGNFKRALQMEVQIFYSVR